MNDERYKENDYERTLIDLLMLIGYNYTYGPDINRELEEPLSKEKLFYALKELNIPYIAQDLSPVLFDEIITEAVRIVTSISDGTLVQRNEAFMDYLQDGVPVKYNDGGREKTATVRLINFENASQNKFEVVNQYSFKEFGSIRCDLVIMVNALPLVVVELKSPSREETDEEDAYKQLRNYQVACPSLFVYNAFNVTSDMLTSRVGTITSTQDRYMEWKSKDGEYQMTSAVDYKTLFLGIFDRFRFIDILQNYICFDHKGSSCIKVMGAYHQYFAVNKAIESFTQAHIRQDGKGGVFWHTQGSGKSFSMVFFVHKLLLRYPGLTVLVVTDRRDLDQQLYTQFQGCSKFLRQEAERVGFDLSEKSKLVKAQEGGRADLKKKLKDLETNHIIFTTIQKFEEETGLLSERNDIVVISDEAHRSQYGIERWDDKENKMKKGYAVLMHEALPNAIFVGFTGTPIDSRDKNTVEVFGDYIDIYDMTQSVADGATTPVYYESRVMNLQLDEESLKLLDDEFDDLSEEGATAEQIEKARRVHSGIGVILCNNNTIKSLCEDIVKHYEENRQYHLSGKAMIVAYNREAAVKIYKQIIAMRPNWKEKVRVVVSSSNLDREEWNDILHPKKEDGKTYWTNDEYAALFKDDNSPMKIAIVVDMWLTGFDVPSLATMYVYKPMRGHNLMQAIARVNRVYPDKKAGMIVDYVGIAQALKEAMHDYTSRDRQRFGDPNIKTTALNKFKEKLEICQDLLHGYDYSRFIDGSNTERADVITGAVNYLLAPQYTGLVNDYIRESQLLHHAETLCRSLLSKELKHEVAFMDAVRVLLTRFRQKGSISKQEINERISKLLEQSIHSTGVINLFKDQTRDFSLFDQAFMDEVKKMKEKNLAIQLLENLLKERLRKYERTNLVQSRKFSEMMSMALSTYLKGMLTNEEVIEELLKMAKAIKEAEEKGNELGLSVEEKAFYDALSSDKEAKKAYTDAEFVAMTKELTEMLRKNRTIDWNQKATSRAKMRVLVKRLLKKYKYPPKGQEAALDIVMEQCNQWADDEEHLI